MENDELFRERVLIPALGKAGFQAHGMGGALELYRAMTVHCFDLAVVAAGLPDEDGFSIAAHLRRLSRPVGTIIMLSERHSAVERMCGARHGADVYLAKPVDTGEVVAAARIVAQQLALTSVASNADARWRLDERAWCIVSPGGVRITTSMAERELVARLAVTPGVPVRREDLIAALAGDSHDFDPHRLEALVYRLRRKCLAQAREELPIRAVRGVGYVLTW